MKKNKIKLFEEFTEEMRKYLIDNDLTYIRKNIDFPKKEGKIYEKIKNYDFSKFSISDTYTITLTPDEGFKKLLIDLNEILEDKINIDINFELSINKSKNMYNEINLDFILPDSLKGLNIGYNIYKLMVKNYHYITSKYGLSKNAKNIWYKFMIDKDYYCFTSTIYSGIINKNISDDILEEILEEIKTMNKVEIEYDTVLKEKIIKFYGSIENYKK